MARHGQSTVAGTPATTPAEGTPPEGAVAAPPAGSAGDKPATGTPPEGAVAVPPVSGGNPPDTGGDEGAARQGEAAPGVETPLAGSGGDKPAAGTPPAPPDPPPVKEGKKRLKCAALKGGKITVGTGEVIQIDKNGVFEVEAKEAARLLTIPDYEEA